MYLIQAVVYKKDEEGEYDRDNREIEEEAIVLCSDKDNIEACKHLADAAISIEVDDINVYNLEDENDRECLVGAVSEDTVFKGEIESDEEEEE